MAAQIGNYLRFRDFVGPDDWYHTARTRYRPGGSIETHTHDFAELFWIAGGSGVHRINGASERLSVGVARRIAPTDRHLFRSAMAESLLLVNVAFPAALYNELLAAYGGDQGYRWIDTTVAGVNATLPPRAVAALGEAFDRLSRARQRRLSIERFLLDFIDIVDDDGVPDLVTSDAPAWFRNGISSFSGDPRAIRLGLDALVALCARSPDHVNRTARHFAGVTATELVTGLRLDAASTMLQNSDRKIVDIALAAGFENLSYFYRVFRRRFGATPRAFRERAHRIVSG